MRRERHGHTLQPTALVHEAFIRMKSGDTPLTPLEGEAAEECSFRANAATTMRRILVDHARRHSADKRGGAWVRVELPEVSVKAPEALELLALDEALGELAALDERLSRIVELRFFGGLSSVEAARVVGVSLSTAEADWSLARAWLKRRIDGSSGSAGPVKLPGPRP